MEQDEFERLVKEAIENLPTFFKEKLENIDVVVEDWPMGKYSRGQMLLGLYQGVPKIVRSKGYSLALPDKITIFQGPIEYIAAGDLESLKQLIKNTVQHEIAHHFGISDKRLRELGK